ncbi:hypothetical protein F5148DRAFT_1284210 [Russula earlei]|uniref:Uncharacterized protein n=1 Tax=Russula earlei TaxID=71964 RepID=A0ACC0U9I1_9AGAM|nr:hypothetical protein F5148DRAFT_1284210 [Russula earlei]
MAATHHAPCTRDSLDSSKYPSIDVFLKALKRHSRTLDALFAQHAAELAVLERLHYINNNQHRPALFWQRVVEAQRYSRRLRSLDVLPLVDGFRRSFYGDMTDTSSKLPKGAWTHHPPAPSLKSFLARLRTCIALLDKTCARMRGIYHILTLAMRSGAFLQVVVTLTAIVARLAHLSSVICRALSTLHAECQHLLSNLHPTEASHNSAPLQPPPPPEREDTNMSTFPLGLNRRTGRDDDLDHSVDLGEAVARTTTVASQLKLRSASPVSLDYLSLVHDASRVPMAGAQQPAADDARPSSALGSSPHQAVILKKNRARPSPSPLTVAEESREKRRKKRKKTPRDEIDEIFS